MAEDYGILISAPGQSVSNATGAGVLLDSSNPFIKIDTQNNNGFVTLNMSIVDDPPNPSSAGGWVDTYTVLYKYAHTYNYRPSIEALFNVTAFAPGMNGGEAYSLDSVFLGAHTIYDGVVLYAVADTEYIYIICDKSNNGSGTTNTLTGTNVTISIHCFVEDVGA